MVFPSFYYQTYLKKIPYPTAEVITMLCPYNILCVVFVYFDLNNVHQPRKVKCMSGLCWKCSLISLRETLTRSLEVSKSCTKKTINLNGTLKFQ